MESDFKTGYKQIIEESLELFGYYLIWFGTLEALLAARWSSQNLFGFNQQRDSGLSGMPKIPELNPLGESR
ncbi:hypothetical protein [Methylocaldum sp.]|uniref:hypothetical protein n=1 Tax=Methylocaldum sp. TaxID=1969727 RepID=UPI002D6A7299|nr:hypothetical protein [Methylocaldum sp.]HYE34333.1 hypothetical protein [Methylocaldum sp.]